MIQKLKSAIDGILADYRATDAKEREAVAALTADTTVQQLRAEKFQQLDKLVVVRRRERESVYAAKNEIVANLASDRNRAGERLADLQARAAAERETMRALDGRIRLATAERDRVQLREVEVTIRLHPGIDRVMAPPEAACLDPRVWPAIMAEAAMKGDGGAHAVTFRYDERTGMVIGQVRYHYTPTAAERADRQRRAAEQIQARRAEAGIDPAGARTHEVAFSAVREDGR